MEKLAQKKLHLSSSEMNRIQRYMKSSPMAAELRMPFAPSNLLFAVGATAGMTIFSQMGADSGQLDLGSAMAFLGDKNFWGGLIGSGVGYSLASIVAMSLIPGGAGFLPMVMPMFAGMAGSILGWEFGSSFFEEGGLSAALERLSPTRILGQAAGTTVGLLIGANLATMVGGTLGAIAGPLGAVAGAMILGSVGAKLGESLKEMLSGKTSGIDEALAHVGASFRETEKVLDKLERTGGALEKILPPSLPSANLATEGLPAALVRRYKATYQDLRQALQQGDRSRAQEKLQDLSRLQANYDNAVGEALQKLAREP
jgi:hypothetical protein